MSTYRKQVKRLVDHGFTRGKVSEGNEGNCCECKKLIRTTRSWWIDGGGEHDDGWNGYCFACAGKRVISDEDMWARADEIWGDHL